VVNPKTTHMFGMGKRVDDTADTTKASKPNSPARPQKFLLAVRRKPQEECTAKKRHQEGDESSQA